VFRADSEHKRRQPTDRRWRTESLYSDRVASASLRLQAEVKRHSARLSVPFKPVARVLSDATNPVRAGPEPQGMVNRGGSHGDDMGFDGASLTAPQPSEGDKREFPRCVAGSLRVRVGTERRRPPESDGRIPPRERGGGGQADYRRWFVSSSVGFIPALKRGAFSSHFRTD